MKHRSNAQTSDTLRVIIVVKECSDTCLAVRAEAGDISATSIRAGDLVLHHGERRGVVEVITEPGGITGTHLIRGRRRQLAAALLVLTDGSVVYAGVDVTKICPDCGRIVVRFK
jgi:hypothetical protein